ncbi:MAG: hypothetical protein QUV05_24350 [Phycisphaerae bacterium]|nr:hypothetical protein [Phycisphaerae bacterium]
MQTIRVMTMVAVVIAAAFSQGCVERLAGEGMEAAMGPKAAYFEEKPLAAEKDHKALEAYKRFELGEVKNMTGKFMPPAFMTYLPAQFNAQLAKSDLPKEASGKTLAFRLSVIHYEAASTMDSAFGPFEEVVARVELVDKDTGQVIGQGVAISRSEKSVNLGPEKKAQGLAKALIKWASDYYPKPLEPQKK